MFAEAPSAGKPVTGDDVTGITGFEDKHEGAHRQRAVRKHVERFRGQAMLALAVVFAALLAPAVWRGVFLSFGAAYETVWPLAFFERPIALLFNGAPWFSGVAVLVVAGAVPLLLLAFQVSYLILYRRERDRDWRVAAAQADAREPVESARGYMNIFRLYARTKRRAIFTLLYAVLAFWWGAAGILAFVSGGLAGQTSLAGYGFFVLASLTIFGGGVIGYLGYDISRRFVPGKILISKTLILSFLATTSQTDYSVAREAARNIEEDLIHEKPWWFYSYKKAPKRYS